MSDLLVTDVVKSFGARPVLSGLTLRVETGSITAILGPSGAGKTTLLRLICGFERADSGSITIDDEVVDDGTRYLPPERRQIGYVPQEGNLFPHLTVAGNIGFGLRRGAASRQRISELLELIDLGGRARSYPHQLSGGEQQRVALARALAVNPRLVLLDEPFASLDASLRASVRADVLTILRDAAATTVLVTHDQDEALSLSDAVAVIRGGTIVQIDRPQTLYELPVDPALAGFVGDVNLLAGTTRRGHVQTALGSLVLRDDAAVFPSGTAVTVMIRPEQLALVPSAGTAEGGATHEVTGQEFYGHDAVIRLRSRDPASPHPMLTVRARGATWSRGALVQVRVDGPVVAWTGDYSSPSSRQP